MANDDTLKTCAICGHKFSGYGNSCYPVLSSANLLCCDQCNISRVIPARFVLTKR